VHAFLLATALSLGSGDGRDGATDGRTVDPSPATLLRVGMTEDEVVRVLDPKRPKGEGKGEFALTFHIYCLKWRGQTEWVGVVYGSDGRVKEWF
jgi:hypothetical protein